MNTLSSHVLDTTLGSQHKALPLPLPDGSTLSGETDNDGRFKNWGVEDSFSAGVYTLRFHCKPYLVETHGNGSTHA